MSRNSPLNPPTRAVRWSDTQQRKDFNRIVMLWNLWKKEHDLSFLEMEAAADGVDAAIEVLDELMKGRIISDE